MIANKKIQALKNASMLKREDTIKRAINAIKTMQEKNMAINFQNVSKQAGVSKTWLYGESKIRTKINKLRNKSGIIKRTMDFHAITQKKKGKLKI